MAEPVGLYVTKSDYAYTRLREGVLSGELAPGTVLNQANLAKTIGISTTPLREALRRLKSEGLVELDAHRDARVTPLTAEEARDLLEVRRSLDPLAVGLAADRRTKEEIRRMRQAAVGLESLGSDPTVADLVAHRAFHAALYAASHNDTLIATLDALWDKADRYRRVGLAAAPGQAARGQAAPGQAAPGQAAPGQAAPGQAARSQAERDRTAREHGELLDAVVRGDSAGAAEVMRQHVDASLGAKAVTRLAGNGIGATVTDTADPS
jgi:DNA-binding GntR family transcriptional regulator